MNFYPHHIGDYISHTAHLSNDEDLAYRRLIELYYQTEGPLALDVQSAARAIRMRDQKDAVEAVLSEFFVATDEGYRHGRCDDEIAKYHGQIEAGKRGAAKRWGKGKDREPIGTPLTPQCDPNSNQEPRTKNHVNPKVKNITPPAFDAVASLLSSGVSEQVARDWIKHRKGKRATVTQTVIDGHISEATKAGISLEAALAYACSAGWQGFEADWYESRSGGKQVNGYRGQTQAQINKEISTRAAIGGLLESIATPLAIQTTGETYDH